MSRVNPTLLIQGSTDQPNPVCPSWWAEHPPSGFTARCWREWQRMRQSRFSAVTRTTIDGPTLPSSIDLYRQAKRVRGAAVLLVLVLVGCGSAAAQTVRTQINLREVFGADALGATLWAQELDGDPRTRDGLLVRLNAKDRMEYLPVGLCPNGTTRQGAWMEPFDIAFQRLPHEWMFVGWIAQAGDRQVYTVQGALFGDYVEMTFDLPPCARTRR